MRIIVGFSLVFLKLNINTSPLPLIYQRFSSELLEHVAHDLGVFLYLDGDV